MKKLLFFLSCMVGITLYSQSLDTSLSIPFLKRNPTIVTNNPPVLILLHGFGSNEKDLFELTNQIPGKYAVYCLRAPINMGHEQYAWYPVDVNDGKPKYNAEIAEKSRLALIKFIEELKKTPGMNNAPIILGGFSQGGILSYSVGLTKPELLRGILVMSGRILDEIKPKIAPKEQIKKLNIYITHGSKDNVLGVTYSRDAALFFRNLNIIPIYREYLAGHMITDKMMLEMVEWLNQ